MFQVPHFVSSSVLSPSVLFTIAMVMKSQHSAKLASSQCSHWRVSFVPLLKIASSRWCHFLFQNMEYIKYVYDWRPSKIWSPIIQKARPNMINLIKKLSIHEFFILLKHHIPMTMNRIPETMDQLTIDVNAIPDQRSIAP